MTDRIFQQHAMAFGSTPCQVVCQIDGKTIYSGTVTTVDEPRPPLPNRTYTIDNVVWSWQNPADFAGTQSLVITVTGSDLVLANTQANDPYNDSAEFGAFYTTEVDGVRYVDPLTDEALNSVPQSGPYDPDLRGQWWWLIPAGSTFSATINVDAPSKAYIVFDSIPDSISPGGSGQFRISIPAVDPQFPLPRTYGWRILNVTTVDADFVSTAGNVEFVDTTSTFSISAAPSASPGIFQAELFYPATGNLINASANVSIS